jgi:hypothetical protein
MQQVGPTSPSTARYLKFKIKLQFGPGFDECHLWKSESFKFLKLFFLALVKLA